MKSLAAVLTASLLAVAASAQSPLVVAPVGGVLLGWSVPAPHPQTFFDLTVSTTITLQALASPIAGPAGQQGTIELWLTNPGITTYAGNETNAASWHRAASGTVIANGTSGSIAQLTCTSCQDTGSSGLVLQPGTYGCAVRYAGIANRFYAVPSATNVFANAELSVTGGAIQFDAFASLPSSPGGGYAGWSWYGRIHYANGIAPHACAEAASYGSGCSDRHASIYAHYTSAAAAASALNGGGISFLPNTIGGYDVLGVAAAPYVAPSASASLIPVGNDGELQQLLTTPFPYPGGVATSLFVHANGFVSVASNATLTGPVWLPLPPPMLHAASTGWWVWHELDPSAAAGGRIWFEEELGSGLVRITWLGVESAPAAIVNPSTFQLVFDPTSGVVVMHFVSLDPIGGASNPPGDGWVVGYSPGGPSPDPGPTDLAALMAGTIPMLRLPPGEVLPLALASSALPMLGTTIDLHTTNATGLSLGALFVGTAPIEPGIELTFLGAPGCAARIDLVSSVCVALSNAGIPGLAMDVPLPVPNLPGLLGARLYGQSIWLDATANTLGLVASNGLALKLGNY